MNMVTSALLPRPIVVVPMTTNYYYYITICAMNLEKRVISKEKKNYEIGPRIRWFRSRRLEMGGSQKHVNESFFQNYLNSIDSVIVPPQPTYLLTYARLLYPWRAVYPQSFLPGTISCASTFRSAVPYLCY